MSQMIPQFGEKVHGAVYRDRPGVYAVVFDEQQRIAVVQMADAYYLPGGGVEVGESPIQTLAREGLEECGCAIVPLREIGFAVQYLTTSSGRHIAKQCRYFVAEFENGPWSAALEPDAILRWLPSSDAASFLALAADAWAVRSTTGESL